MLLWQQQFFLLHPLVLFLITNILLQLVEERGNVGR